MSGSLAGPCGWVVEQHDNLEVTYRASERGRIVSEEALPPIKAKEVLRMYEEASVCDHGLGWSVTRRGRLVLPVPEGHHRRGVRRSRWLRARGVR